MLLNWLFKRQKKAISDKKELFEIINGIITIFINQKLIEINRITIFLKTEEGKLSELNFNQNLDNIINLLSENLINFNQLFTIRIYGDTFFFNEEENIKYPNTFEIEVNPNFIDIISPSRFWVLYEFDRIFEVESWNFNFAINTINKLKELLKEIRKELRKHGYETALKDNEILRDNDYLLSNIGVHITGDIFEDLLDIDPPKVNIDLDSIKPWLIDMKNYIVI